MALGERTEGEGSQCAAEGERGGESGRGRRQCVNMTFILESDHTSSSSERREESRAERDALKTNFAPPQTDSPATSSPSLPPTCAAADGTGTTRSLDVETPEMTETEVC